MFSMGKLTKFLLRHKNSSSQSVSQSFPAATIFRWVFLWIFPISNWVSHGFPMVSIWVQLKGYLSAGQVHAPKVGVQRGLVPVLPDMEMLWGL